MRRMNENKRKECDKCYQTIIDGKCECGVWCDYDQASPLVKLLKKTIDKIDESHELDFCFSGWDHTTHIGFVYFRSDDEYMCERVKDYIQAIQNKN